MSVFKIFRMSEADTGDVAYDLVRTLNYVRRPEATNRYLIGGYNVDWFSPFEDIMGAKMAIAYLAKNNPMRGKGFHHCVVSLEAETKLETAIEIKMIFDKVAHFLSAWDGTFQVFYAIHFNTKHWHVHYVINNLDIEDGHRWIIDPKSLLVLKDAIRQFMSSLEVKEEFLGKSY